MAALGFATNLIKAQWITGVPQVDVTFDNQTVIITGANTGLGAAAAEHAVRRSAAKVIIACRTVSKGETAKTKIEKATGRKGVLEVWALDLASHDSIKAFAARAEKELDRLDVFIANAGIQVSKFSLVNGFENTISINVISTFLLALLVLPKMKQTAAAHPMSTPHLVILASDTHMLASLPEANNEAPIFDQLNDEKKTSMQARYPLSKFLDILVTFAMVDKLPKNYPVVIDTVNPGLCRSELSRESPSLAKVVYTVFHARTAEEGAQNSIFAASAGKQFHGKYISECAEGPMSKFFTSDEWRKPGERVWNELVEVLEKISPGIMARV